MRERCSECGDLCKTRIGVYCSDCHREITKRCKKARAEAADDFEPLFDRSSDPNWMKFQLLFILAIAVLFIHLASSMFKSGP